MFIAACADQPVTMLGPMGSIQINSNQYQNNIRCGWKIQVEADKVSDKCIKFNANKTITIQYVYV